MIDVSELMEDPDFAVPGGFLVTRRADGTGTFGNEGEWTPGTPRTFRAYGTIQPASVANKVDYLPEGERESEAVNVWTRCELKMSDGDGKESDIILFNGNTYRVANCKPWGCNGFWYAIATEFTE